MTSNLRVADAVISVLISRQVEVIFGVVGGNAMYLNDAVRISGIRFVPFHNEQSAAIAADAYARRTGGLAVCLVTSGPGASNTTTGIAGMYLDSAPVLIISGQSKTSELVAPEMGKGVRQKGTFELPMVAILSPITKKAHRLKLEENVYTVVDELIDECLTGRPGPVFLEIPSDVQSCFINEFGNSQQTSLVDVTAPKEDFGVFVSQFMLELGLSSRPLLIVGHGARVSNQVTQLLDMATKIGVPIVTTQIAKDVICYEHPLFIGHIGIRGDRPGNLALQEADLILSIGCSLQQQTTGYEVADFAPNSKLFILDFEESVTSKKSGLRFEKSINLDCMTFFKQFSSQSGLTQIDKDRFESWRILNIGRKRSLSVENEPHNVSSLYLNLYELVFGLNRTFVGNECYVSDAGLCFYVLGQALHLGENQRYLVSGGLGAMGWALPASIGAALVSDYTVICIIGDGSMQMCLQELATLKSQELNCKIFVINNNGYASIRNTQKSFFSEDFIGCDPQSGLIFPNWKSISEAYGVEYTSISDRQFLLKELSNIRNHVGPLLIEVLTQESQEIMPTVTSIRGEDGKLYSNSLDKMSPDIVNSQPGLHFN